MTERAHTSATERYHTWTKSIRAGLLGLSKTIADWYGDQERWDHYYETGLQFARVLPTEEAIAQAGFLHGIRETGLLKHLPVHRDVEPILVSQRRLWSIVRLDSDVPSHLVASVLPSLDHAGGALLLVREQLAHLDGKATMLAFTERFRRKPDAALDSVEATKGKRDQRLKFLEKVVQPTAEFFGLWHYRNVADNLYLFHTEPKRFEEIREFAVHSAVKGRPKRFVNAAADVLGEMDVEIAWEWHHVASLDRVLTGSSRSWPGRLSRCGMVTVICETPEDCYLVLSRLHLAPGFEHRPSLKDLIAAPLPSGYQAIHTTISPKGQLDVTSEAIRVRILTREMHAERSSQVDERRLAAMQRQLAARRPNELRVFAPDGKPVYLVPESTVLNFAFSIHKDFAALVRSAKVNDFSADILQRLREGDVVDLEVGEAPRPLPAGWESRVPRATVKKLRRQMHRMVRPHLVKSGRNRLRQLLSANGGREMGRLLGIDDSSLDSIVEDALRETKGRSRQEGFASAEEFLRRLAESGECSERMLRAVATRVQHAKTIPLEDFVLPKEMHGTFDSLTLCEKCQPTPSKELVGCLTDRRLVIHEYLRKCVQEGSFRVTWRRRFSRGQYFVVEMNNRQGIASEILSFVSARRVDLQDHVGASLGPGWAVLRFHVHAISEGAAEAICAGIAAIPGVIRVLGPGEAPVQALEGPLPPRERRALATRTSPYLCGPVIMDRRYFYGRTKELTALRVRYDDTRRGTGQGLHVFVSGPFKVGKTSLVEHFLSEVRERDHRAVIVRFIGFPREDWAAASSRLSEHLVAELRAASAEFGRAGELRHLPPGEILARFRSQSESPVILRIDEAISVCLATSNGPHETAMSRFFLEVAQVAGVLAIWIGPGAPVVDLSEPLLHSIRMAQRIRVEPLGVHEVQALLEAKNMDGMGLEIQAPEGLGRQLERFTGGNPYWCNLIAEQMFHDADTVGDGRVVYNQPLLASACQRVVQEGYAFEDRIAEQNPGGSTRGVVAAVLRRLAEMPATSEGLSTSKLREAITKRGYPMGDSEFRALLDRLTERGSIRVSEAEEWVIDSPALRRYVLKETRPIGGEA
jgi:hypothetical protein